MEINARMFNILNDKKFMLKLSTLNKINSRKKLLQLFGINSLDS